MNEIVKRILTVALYGNANKEIREHLHRSFEQWQESGLECSPQFEAQDWFAMADAYDAAQEFQQSNYSI